MYSKMKLFGHPIHPMVVAYPVAFYTATLVSFIVYGTTADAFWLKLAIAMNVAGVAMAVVAALPGFIDWLVAIPRKTDASRTGVIHMLLNVGALALFGICAAIYIPEWTTPVRAAGTGIVLSALGVGLTIAAGFQGWKLVQDHHVGVRLTSEQERQEPLRRAG